LKFSKQRLPLFKRTAKLGLLFYNTNTYAKKKS
jgi:hypothetical protein